MQGQGPVGAFELCATHRGRRVAALLRSPDVDSSIGAWFLL